MNTHDPIVGRYVYVQCEGKTYRTYYEENGEGIPLVCLHTAGTDGRQYRHQLCDPEITANFRVIAFDLPWHGKSLPPSDFYLKEDEYKLTAKFYSDFIVAFCHALELKKPVIMGQSMGGNVCLTLALRYEHEFLALIALEACDYSPGWWIEPLHHPHIHGGEVVATSVFGLMSPESPDEYRWETWWYYAQGGPGVFKGDLYFYSVDSDYRDQVSKISGKLPIYLSHRRLRFRLHARNDRAHRREGQELGMHHLLRRSFPDLRRSGEIQGGHLASAQKGPRARSRTTKGDQCLRTARLTFACPQRAAGGQCKWAPRRRT